MCIRCPVLHSMPHSSSSTSQLLHRVPHVRPIATGVASRASEAATGRKFGLAPNGKSSRPSPRGTDGRVSRPAPAVDGSDFPHGKGLARHPGLDPTLRAGEDNARSPNTSSRNDGPRQPRNAPFPAPRAGPGRLPNSPNQPRQVGRSLAQTIDFLKQSRASDTLDQALSKSEEHYTTRHLGKDVDFSQMPSQPRFKDTQRRVVS